MFGFPISNGNSGYNDFVEKFTNNADSGFPKIQQREVFYSIKDGNWSDASVWQTASGRVGLLPTQYDDVYIRNHTIQADTTTVFLNNLFVLGTLKYDNVGSFYRIIHVYGNCKCYGTIDGTSGTGFGFSIYLYGTDNVINTYIPSTGSTTEGIYYARNGDQEVLPLTYRRLHTLGSGIKYLAGNVTVTYETIINAGTTLELGGFNFSSGNQSQLKELSLYGTLSKNSPNGNTIFVSALSLIVGGLLDFSVGNPNVEVRNGIIHGNSFNGFVRFRPGTGTWSFTTNNQALQDSNANGVLPFYGNIYVDSNITLTIGSGGGTKLSVYLYTNTLGGNASSKIMNRDNLYFITDTAANNFMIGSQFDFTTYTTNTVYFGGNYSTTIDTRFTTFHNLTISGTGIKTLGVNTTLNGNLLLQGVTSTNTSGILELSTFNLSVTGTTTFASGKLSKSGAGNILFVGQMLTGTGSNCNTIDFSGNPTVEFRGGISGGTYSWSTSSAGGFNTGTGIWSFTTNNQTVSFPSTPVYAQIFNCPIIISGAITLTWTSPLGGATLNNYINGDNANSKLLQALNSAIIFATQTAAENSMSVGIADFTTNANTIIFGGNYSATIPSYFTTFHNLTINGGGTKTLSTNTTLNGNLTLNGTGILQLATYDFTVNGVTSWQNSNNQLLKSGAGSILFVGKLDRITGIVNNTNVLDFSIGNPNVELRGGIDMAGGHNWANFKTGTGTWSFTTNNQTIQQNATINFDCPILIVGAISLTLSTVAAADFNVGLYNTINGTVAGSTLVVGNNTSTFSTNLNLYVNTTFMTTGTVDLTKTSGKVAYLFNGNFTLPYSSYNGLVIGGTGTKTPSSNLTIGQRGLTINGGTLDLSTYNLTNNTTTNINVGTLLKTGAGNVLFGGRVQYLPNNGCNIDFRTGNPTVELRGGLGIAAPGTSTLFTGNGTWTFSTNNQTIQSGNANITLDAPVIISGAISLTHSFSSGSFSTLIFKNTVNGDNAASTLINGSNCTINYQSATQPMVTGILDTSTNLNTWIYGLSNQDIKGGPTTLAKQVYRNLTLNGGGTKTLQGYVSVLNTYTLTAPATLALNGYTLTNP